MTGLDHIDRIAALRPGAWIMAANDTQGIPSEGGLWPIPAGSKARVVGFWGALDVELTSGKSVTLHRESLLDWDVAHA